RPATVRGVRLRVSTGRLPGGVRAGNGRAGRVASSALAEQRRAWDFCVEWFGTANKRGRSKRAGKRSSAALDFECERKSYCSHAWAGRQRSLARFSIGIRSRLERIGKRDDRFVHSGVRKRRSGPLFRFHGRSRSVQATMDKKLSRLFDV